MILEEKVIIPINNRNLNQYKEKYNCEAGTEIEIFVSDLNTGSHTKITAICDNPECKNRSHISYNKYLTNINRNNSNIYYCKSCNHIKRAETCKIKYGHESFSNTDKFKENGNRLSRNYIIKTLDKKGLVYELTNDNQIITNCSKCSNNYIISYRNYYQRTTIYDCVVCTNCNPLKRGDSDKEIEIFEYIKSIYNGTIIRKDKNILNGKELDIYLPELNLAIEFNGSHWHSIRFKAKDKKYHYNKYLNCLSQGIRLLQISEADFLKDKSNILEILKSYILDNKVVKYDKYLIIDNMFDHNYDLSNYVLIENLDPIQITNKIRNTEYIHWNCGYSYYEISIC